MRYLIVVKECTEESTEPQEPKVEEYSLPNETVANLIMQSDGFKHYIHKYGYHFTPELAMMASDLMTNANGINHKWTTDQIKTQLEIHGWNDLGSNTIGDVTYLANMAYADFYPDVIKTELDCIKYAMAVIKDPDGYDGMAMQRWIADIIGKEFRDVEWDEFIK